MSDRICIMRDDRIVQVGSPQDLYDRPNSKYVADFVGTSNFFDGKITDQSGELTTVCLSNGMHVRGTPVGEPISSGDVCISVRPEQMKLHRQEDGLAVEVRNRIFLGEHTEYLVNHKTLGDFLVLSPRQSERAEGAFAVGDSANVSWEDSAALILDRN